MKVKGLDGREYTWKLTGRVPLADKACSAPHARARRLLEALFPHERRLEEIPLPGSGKLTADFYLPARKLMVEIHGKQHYQYTAHFHKNPLGFLKSKQRDGKKEEWCDANGLCYVELPHDEPDAEWTRRILNASAGLHGGTEAEGT